MSSPQFHDSTIPGRRLSSTIRIGLKLCEESMSGAIDVKIVLTRPLSNQTLGLGGQGSWAVIHTGGPPWLRT
jgi:hypothetical protein